MIPTLYAKSEKNFTHNGIGFLVDAIKCIVSEERNGSYELSLQYPITGRWFEQITDGAIIRAKANETSEPQLFRIYKSSKPLKGVVTYSAEHISYDLNGIPSLGITVKNVTPQAAMTQAFAAAELSCPFTALSDISTLNSTSILSPCGLRSILGGQRGSILDVWGGEYEFDNFTVKLHKQRGSDNGVSIEYGKNLIDLKQESNITDCYTHILPYAAYTEETENDNGGEHYVYLSEKILPLTSAENVGCDKAYIMDFSDRFGEDEKITEDALRVKVTAYMRTTQLGTPKITLTVSFVQLWQTEEYKNIAPLERVKLCDIVTVKFTKLGIAAKVKVIKTVYDSLNERYESITLGDSKGSFSDTVIETSKSIAAVQQSVERAELSITRTNDRLTAEAMRAKGEEEALSAKIELTAESITSEVTKAISAEVIRAKAAESGLGEDISTLDTTLTSKIEQTAESITAEVTRATGAEEALGSRITLTAESLTSEITSKVNAETTRAQAAESGLGDGISELDTTLTSKIEQTAESIAAEVTRAKGVEETLSARITQTFDNITLSVSETSADNQTSSTLTLKKGNVTISSATVKGTTATQAAKIASDAVNGITLSVTNSTTDATSTLTLKSGSTTITSGKIELKGLVSFSDLKTKNKTEINGDNITTGTISAERIDVESLYITKVYTTLPDAQKSKQTIIFANGKLNGNTELFIGGQASSYTSNVGSTFVMGKSYVYIGCEYTTVGMGSNLKTLCFDTSNRVVRCSTTNYNWSLGNSNYPFESLYVKTAQMGNSSQGKIGFFGTTPASRQTVAQLSANANLSQCITKINSLLSSLKTYGLITY